MRIYDKFFTPPLLEVIQDQIKHLRYETHDSAGLGAHDSSGANTFLFSGEIQMIRLWQYIFDKIITKMPIKERLVTRCYVNKYPPNTFSDWHIDNEDGGCAKTIIFYPDEDGASTVFEKKEIQYKQNRLLYFDSGLRHKTNINDTNKDRHTLVYKVI
tara:strand:- start:13 stop:483 length:471 start_codon:yes stop_codon:yes gene_type:complete